MRTTSYYVSDALQARADRNRAFESGLEYLQRNHIPGKIGDVPFRFYWNINFYVDLASRCNCHCAFCINHVTFERNDISDGDYVKRFEGAIRTIRHLGPSLQIVGGEALLEQYRDRLFGVLNVAKEYNIRKPIVGTNGSALRDLKLVEALDPYLAHLNISRHHYDDGYLNARKEVLYLDDILRNDELYALFRSRLSSRIRLNCCLLSGYVDCHAEVVRYIEWAMAAGCQNIAFADLTQLPENYIYTEKFVTQVQCLRIDFEKLMAEVTLDSRFHFVKFHTGTHCMYEVWDYAPHNGQSCTVVFATSNNEFAKRLDAIEDLIELLVFHTDGTLAASWNKKAKRLTFETSDIRAA